MVNPPIMISGNGLQTIDKVSINNPKQPPRPPIMAPIPTAVLLTGVGNNSTVIVCAVLTETPAKKRIVIEMII